MNEYNHKDIESKWQKYWKEEGTYTTQEYSDKPKCYVLDMFPYPSGTGLHVGHPRGFIATDVYARMKRMNGYNVLHPMGWDAFGLPAENHALANKTHPSIQVKKNIKNFTGQLAMMGPDYDWSREINTTDPAFYKWTQWCFLKMLEKGLAYESYEPINWCPGCKTGLANEDLDADGTCERCSSIVEKKPMRQWVLRITQYADRLIDDLDTLEQWPEWVKEAQRNWISRSYGSKIPFILKTGQTQETIEIFTTRADTLFGCTYFVLAPEHKFIQQHEAEITNIEEVKKYQESLKTLSVIDRTAHGKEKTGIRLEGVTAINPANGEEIPVWIADYVLADYGTGAVMAVPAHDERDFAFAKKYELPIKNVINPMFTRADVAEVAEKDFEKKNKIVAVVRDPDNNILTINWGEALGGRLLLGGTIEEGETPEQTALRELAEETGYDDAEVIAVAPETFKYRYFATSKGRAFEADTRFVHIQLNSLNKKESALEEDEKNKFSVEWISQKDIEKNVVEVLHVYALSKFVIPTAYVGMGYLGDSEKFTNLTSEEAKEKITKHVGGSMVSSYKLRDWVFSRQRYWGEPIPVVHCEKCGVVAVPYEQLPVVLPDVESYEPTGTGESPLASIEAWVNVACPTCGGNAKRETNTMPQWAGSSWYYLRYIDPKNNDALINPEKEKYWNPVDVYVGGDHATRHLIYARFWHKFLYDIGAVTHIEPFPRLEFLGHILGEDGTKISKRKGNGAAPEDVIEKVGADTLRTYEMFIGPFEKAVPWSSDGLVGVRRFLEKVWRIAGAVSEKSQSSAEVQKILHKTIKKIGEDIEHFKFNTAVSQMMILANTIEKEGGIAREDFISYLKILAPFAPHMSEEIWQSILGNTSSIHLQSWPEYDGALTKDDTVILGVQINGKVRGELELALDADEASVRIQILENTAYAKWIPDGVIKKFIYIPGKIISIVA